VLSYLKDAHSEVRVFDVKGNFQHALAVPGIGSVRGFAGRQHDRATYYNFSSFTAPNTIYEYEPASNTSKPFRAPRLSFDPALFETEQVFTTSADGTRVPIFLIHRKGVPSNGATPTYLYGYGGFNISITPMFYPEALEWVEMGGLYAVATLRGGGEYGTAWHEAGMKAHKQNVFDDFIAAARFLVSSGRTRTDRLAIGGHSNGGLLIGACLTQHPELFGAAVPGVGVMDMLRFHRFTIGWAWTDEYGSSDDANDFRALFAYSPLHNIRPGTHYPATLVTTADHDDRVVPAHSFKFAAALQAAQAGPAPALIRIETRAGHGGATPTGKLIEEQADRWAFLVRALKFSPWSEGAAGSP
jgi:prolyl oligopeptidase